MQPCLLDSVFKVITTEKNNLRSSQDHISRGLRSSDNILRPDSRAPAHNDIL